MQLWFTNLHYNFMTREWSTGQCLEVPRHMIIPGIPVTFNSLTGYWLMTTRAFDSGYLIDPAREIHATEAVLARLDRLQQGASRALNQRAEDLAQQAVARASRRY